MPSTENATSEMEYQNPYDDPLFLSNSDFPGMQLVNPLFNGKNYLSWNRGIVMALGSKNKCGFLTGETTMPGASSAKLQQWKRTDNMVRHWDDIEELEGFPDCTCSILEKCTCSVLKKILERDSKEKVMTFLMGLNDGFDTVRSSMLSMDPLPPINKVYSIVQQIESQKMITNILNSAQNSSALAVENAALAVNRPSGHNTWNTWRRDAKKQKVDEMWCTHCNKSGHVREKCFRLHPEQKIKYQSRFSTTANLSESIPKDEVQLSSSNSDAKVEPSLVAAVYQEMLKMMHSQSASGGFMDTPFSSANYADIQIHPEILLENVLYIPDFKHNLISVSKLVHNNQLQAPRSKQTLNIGLHSGGLYKFSPLVQHAVCRSDLSVGLPSCSSCASCNNQSHVDLLHARLGHTSLSKMQHIPDAKCTHLKHYHCDVCVLAKMHQFPFNKSDSRAALPFELVHIDLWGPYKTATISGQTNHRGFLKPS
ncbi:hypothetical protein RND81_05G164700 [Saponaria officinalis]|uniref:Retrotransposon Copia-like N-terminal domain-containing protein n=1 Tax=Saponaria officinalis TaxID=3572 RepID=A0AAW1KSX9_SAPOF